MLNVWVVPTEEIAKSVPLVPVAKVCVVPVSPFSEVIPVAGGAAHVPSPLQNVELEAEVPLFRFATGKFPVTSADRLTAANDGAPPAFPWRTVVVVPSDPSVETAVVFPPSTSWLRVSVAAAVTFPLPAGVAHVPSPLQKVELEAPVPELRFVVGRLPVTSAVKLTAPNVGRPAALPCKTVVVVPVEARVCEPCEPEPTMTAFAVSEAALVTQVGHPAVPVAVIVPPVNGDANVMLVTVPVPGGAAHVPSPRQKVAALAPAPLAKLIIGRFPVTSVVRFTAPKVGAPAALPCRTVVVVPKLPSIVTACDPFPRTKRFAVSVDPVTQVVQPMVPVVVIVPPVIGEVVAMLVTVPEPAGVAQMPSPRQKVEAEARFPPLRLVTGKLPVTPPLALEARLIGGMSAETWVRNVGSAAPPEAGPI